MCSKRVQITCIQALSQKNANIALPHKNQDNFFHIIQILSEEAKKSGHYVRLASMGHVLYAKLNIEKFKWLTSLIKTYKETVHEVDVGTYSPHAQSIFWNRRQRKITLKVSLRLKIKMK